MPEMDRSKRYANPPKAKNGKMQDKGEVKADSTVKKDAADPAKSPTDAKPGPVGKVGEDPGPEGSPSPEFGVVAKQKADEIGAAMKMHADNMKIHTDAMTAEAERHGKHMKEMTSRHQKTGDGMQDKGEQGAEKKAAATAGSPKELGKPKDEGKKGSEA